MFSGDIKRDEWNEMGQLKKCALNIKTNRGTQVVYLIVGSAFAIYFHKNRKGSNSYDSEEKS